MQHAERHLLIKSQVINQIPPSRAPYVFPLIIILHSMATEHGLLEILCELKEIPSHPYEWYVSSSTLDLLPEAWEFEGSVQYLSCS